ncbi:MAG: glucokinase [Thermoanaerobaculia bacterium]
MGEGTRRDSDSPPRVVLAGDIGGTNVRLGLFTLEDGRLVRQAEVTLRSREFRSLEEAAASWAGSRRDIPAAVFGVAGPVREGRCEATNLPWVVDAAHVGKHLGVPHVVLLNDLVAGGLGLAELSEDDFAIVNGGQEDPEGCAAMVSPGTGLGEGFLVREGAGWRVHPSEGGHASFAPRTEWEVDLLRHLQKEYSHVSIERIVSGPGLAAVYRFERERSRVPEPVFLAKEIARRGDAAPAVSGAALAGTDPVAIRSLNRWISIWGAEAGNLALKVMATGGVYLGGGIAPKVLPKLLDGTFFEAFRDKGRLKPLLSRVPVRVVRNDGCALLGAARAAARIANGEAVP